MPKPLPVGSREDFERRTTQHPPLAYGSANLVSATPDVTGGAAWFAGSSFRGADMRQATVDTVHFSRCDLRDVDLRGASLRGTSFFACDLRGADLRGADLRGAELRGRESDDPRDRTDLTGARLDPGALDHAEVHESTVLPDGF